MSAVVTDVQFVNDVVATFGLIVVFLLVMTIGWAVVAIGLWRARRLREKGAR